MKDKKLQKAISKAKKKQLKALSKQAKSDNGSIEDKPADSSVILFAEGVRGVLFLVMSISMMVGIFLAQKGYIITLKDIFESMILVWAGRIILVIISLAFFVLGLKMLRVIK